MRSGAIEATRETLRKLGNVNADGHREIFNLALYLLLLDQDLADSGDLFATVVGKRRRALVARHVAIVVYEAAEDLRQMLGTSFRVAVKRLDISAEFKTQIDAAASDLNQFWIQERAFLKEIRTTVAAHREHDALKYLSALEGVDPVAVLKRAGDLSLRFERLLTVLTAVAVANSGVGSMFQDVVASSRGRTGQKTMS